MNLQLTDEGGKLTVTTALTGGASGVLGGACVLFALGLVAVLLRMATSGSVETYRCAHEGDACVREADKATVATLSAIQRVEVTHVGRRVREERLSLTVRPDNHAVILCSSGLNETAKLRAIEAQLHALVKDHAAPAATFTCNEGGLSFLSALMMVPAALIFSVLGAALLKRRLASVVFDRGAKTCAMALVSPIPGVSTRNAVRPFSDVRDAIIYRGTRGRSLWMNLVVEGMPAMRLVTTRQSDDSMRELTALRLRILAAAGLEPR